VITTIVNGLAAPATRTEGQVSAIRARLTTAYQIRLAEFAADIQSTLRKLNL
jgi:hypothetical protein